MEGASNSERTKVGSPPHSRNAFDRIAPLGTSCWHCGSHEALSTAQSSQGGWTTYAHHLPSGHRPCGTAPEYDHVSMPNGQQIRSRRDHALRPPPRILSSRFAISSPIHRHRLVASGLWLQLAEPEELALELPGHRKEEWYYDVRRPQTCGSFNKNSALRRCQVPSVCAQLGCRCRCRNGQCGEEWVLRVCAMSSAFTQTLDLSCTEIRGR